MYLITTCASCAAPLSTGVKNCSRCKTRYCGASCQRAHWKRGDHKKECAAIADRGGAENAHVITKLAGAIREAEVHAGATCYICESATPPDTPESLVRGCACRGTEGFAHLPCLARQAQLAAENQRASRAAMWARWHTCQQCGQQYHGVVRHVLGWSCWMNFGDRPDLKSRGNELRCQALDELGYGLFAVGRYKDALAAFTGAATCWEALSLTTKSEYQKFVSQTLIAMCCSKLGYQGRAVLYGNVKTSAYKDGLIGRVKECEQGHLVSGVDLMHDAVQTARIMFGQNHEYKSLFFLRLVACLVEHNMVGSGLVRAAVCVARSSLGFAIQYVAGFDTIAEVARAHGEDHAIVIELGWRYAQVIYLSHFYGRDDYRRALVNSIRSHIRVLGQASRVLGIHYPMTQEIAASLKLCFDEQLDWSVDDTPGELLAVRPLLDDVPADLARRLEGIVDSDDEGYPLGMWRERWRKKNEIQRRKNEADYKKLLADAAEQSLDPDSVPPAAPPRWKAGRVRSTRPEDWPAG